MIGVSGCIAVASLLATWFVFDALPPEIPIHFGLNGADSFMAKQWVWAMTGFPAFVCAGLVVSVRKSISAQQKTSVQAMQAGILAVTGFLVALIWAAIALSLGYAINMNAVVKFCIGCLFLVMGIVMPRIKPNPSFGLRYPWLLNDEVAWVKTHRLAGWGMSFLGLVALSLSFVDAQWTLIAFMVAIFSFLILTSVYSWRVRTR